MLLWVWFLGVQLLRAGLHLVAILLQDGKRRGSIAVGGFVAHILKFSVAQRHEQPRPVHGIGFLRQTGAESRRGIWGGRLRGKSRRDQSYGRCWKKPEQAATSSCSGARESGTGHALSPRSTCRSSRPYSARGISGTRQELRPLGVVYRNRSRG